MAVAWREQLLETRFLAVLSAVGVALLAFPGAELAADAVPRAGVGTHVAESARVVASKGPQTRLSGAPAPEVVREAMPAPAPAAPVPAVRDEPAQQESADSREPRAFEGCLATHSSAACRRAFETVVERQRTARGFQTEHTRASIARAGFAPLAFDDRQPLWIRRVEALAEDGIAFKRMRRGPDRELVFGINADGVLGFTLTDTRRD